MTGILGDRPLSEGDVDVLGFQPMAQKLAEALVSRASKDGIVVGLEGEWGSGKSSMLALTTHALRQLPVDRRPAILSFHPWLIGHRDALLTSLFEELAETVASMQVNGSGGRSTDAALSKLPDTLRTYGRRLGALAPLASIAGFAGVPWADKFAGALGKIKVISTKHTEQKPLASAKQDIDKLLARIPQRIIVLIDDVDRLEPNEIAEVLRLVRSVADFYNVVYVLCYDYEIVCNAIKTVIHAEDGKKYLEKIVQVSLRVPAPEPFVLRKMFESGLREFARAESDDAKIRLASVIDQHGGSRLPTPRAVNRTLDALRFVWPAVCNKVDLPDLVWLQFIRMSNPELFSWIESYCASMAAVSSGRARIEANQRSKSLESLKSSLTRDGDSLEDARWSLSVFLPGISGVGESPKFNGESPIFNEVSDKVRAAAIQDRRLASPDHYRLYFALTQPSGAPHASDFIELWTAADKGHVQVSDLIRRWFAEPAFGNASKGELMLDRLRRVPDDVFQEPRCENLLLALADTLDETFRDEDERDLLGFPSWRQGENLLPILLSRMGPNSHSVVVQAFRESRSIGWLVEVFRRETFAHGRFGDRKRPEHEWLLSEKEYEAILECMHERFGQMTLDEVFATPQPISLLFAWSQTGGADEARKLVQSGAETDEDLLKILLNMTSKIQSSAGDYLVIKPEVIEQFMDLTTVRDRVGRIAETDSNLTEGAREIMRRLEAAKHW